MGVVTQRVQKECKSEEEKKAATRRFCEVKPASFSRSLGQHASFRQLLIFQIRPSRHVERQTRLALREAKESWREAQPRERQPREGGSPKMRHAMTRRQLYGFLFGVMVVLYGCAAGTTRKAASIKSAKNVTVSAAELSSRNRSLLGVYSAEIEAAADKIMQESPSPVTRREALVWKAEAIPVLQTSLLNTDPLAAAIDTWAFIFQMKTYMEQPVM